MAAPRLDPDGHARCPWLPVDPVYLAYHDTEWGVPEHDGRALFEKLILDGFQAGLSWITILRKRERFRAVFEGFEPERLAAWAPAEVDRALADPGIVRNRAKVEATVGNARALLAMGGPDAFSRYWWEAVGGRPVPNAWAGTEAVPAETELSRRLSRDLRARGFRFCGPTIVYAFMQAVGLVNDHLVGCWRHGPCAALGGPARG